MVVKECKCEDRINFPICSFDPLNTPHAQGHLNLRLGNGNQGAALMHSNGLAYFVARGSIFFAILCCRWHVDDRRSDDDYRIDRTDNVKYESSGAGRDGLRADFNTGMWRARRQRGGTGHGLVRNVAVFHGTSMTSDLTNPPANGHPARHCPP